jgi:hypothetical protein
MGKTLKFLISTVMYYQKAYPVISFKINSKIFRFSFRNASEAFVFYIIHQATILSIIERQQAKMFKKLKKK